MSQEEVDIYNEWFKEIDWLQITENLSFKNESHFYEGTFVVSIEDKENLEFDIRFRKNYPNNNINFICRNADGYEHQMPDGLICHNPDVFFKKEAKFFHEFEKLKLWVEKFYVREERSNHYEHLIFPDPLNKLMLFPELDLKYHQEERYGYFQYITFNQIGNKQKVNHETYLLMGLDEFTSYYSSSFKDLSHIKGYHIKQGIWLQISTPPVLYRRKPINKWSDLFKLLNNHQIKHLYSYRDLVFKKKGKEAKYLILLSYAIPNTEKEIKEAHFELIEDHVKEEPQETKYKRLQSYHKIDRKDKINWGKTKNISYENYFGRGLLSKNLVSKKILVIGIGAIGSSLAKILVRGGATYIGIIDFDRVESGNICRSEYKPISIQESKIIALERELVSISPFVEISKDDLIFPTAINSDLFKERKANLQSYDIIFDCTTDKYLSNILDQMHLRGKVINFSISNKAQEFVCITGSGNITTQKTRIYNELGKEEKQEPFYPEVGCFHPTFEASYNDINFLLNYALKEIDRRLKNEIGLQSFMIQTSDDSEGIKADLNYDL